MEYATAFLKIYEIGKTVRLKGHLLKCKSILTGTNTFLEKCRVFVLKDFIYFYGWFCFVLLFWHAGDPAQDFKLARQALYQLSYTSNT